MLACSWRLVLPSNMNEPINCSRSNSSSHCCESAPAGLPQEGGFYMPLDDAEISKGYAFIEFSEAEVRFMCSPAVMTLQPIHREPSWLSRVCLKGTRLRRRSNRSLVQVR